MSLDGQYDPNNIFAKIIRGEIPSAKVFEDEQTLAFMDAFPQARGHTLVIHKHSTARNLLDVAPDDLNAVMRTVNKLARAVRASLHPDGIMISQFNGAPAGQTVFHLHVHIIPRWEGVTLGRHAASMANSGELRSLADQIAGAIED